MDMLLSAIIMFIGILGVVVVIALVFPLGLGEKADPFFTPPNIKPDCCCRLWTAAKHALSESGLLLWALELWC